MSAACRWPSRSAGAHSPASVRLPLLSLTLSPCFWSSDTITHSSMCCGLRVDVRVENPTLVEDDRRAYILGAYAVEVQECAAAVEVQEYAGGVVSPSAAYTFSDPCWTLTSATTCRATYMFCNYFLCRSSLLPRFSSLMLSSLTPLRVHCQPVTSSTTYLFALSSRLHISSAITCSSIVWSMTVSSATSLSVTSCMSSADVFITRL